MKLLKNPQLIARQVLLDEAEAIRKVTERLDNRFDDCVNKILSISGRVVVTGIGKSAIIAQKIVATLNSTGTPALFMHAADAIHGDLGMIREGDVVIAISRSGNTPEIKVLVPLLKRTGVPLIGMVSDTGSYLAKHSDYVLEAYAEREADPLDLAPTTSTTVALALGDALAVSLLVGRDFTRQDFARYHPGGSLGKKLYLKVADIYPHNACPKVSATTPVKEAIIEISSKRLGATAVLNPDDTLAGIITDGDVRRMLNRSDDFRTLVAQDIMTVSPVCVCSDDYAVRALEIMQERNITQLVVVDDGLVQGFVHLHDLLKEGIV
nr:KpsF/GutQ family sugar-phosphate isomerase [uncultured Arsenicibacter sp.]